MPKYQVGDPVIVTVGRMKNIDAIISKVNIDGTYQVDFENWNYAEDELASMKHEVLPANLTRAAFETPEQTEKEYGRE